MWWKRKVVWMFWKLHHPNSYHQQHVFLFLLEKPLLKLFFPATPLRHSAHTEWWLTPNSTLFQIGYCLIRTPHHLDLPGCFLHCNKNYWGYLCFELVFYLAFIWLNTIFTKEIKVWLHCCRNQENMSWPMLPPITELFQSEVKMGLLRE